MRFKPCVLLLIAPLLVACAEPPQRAATGIPPDAAGTPGAEPSAGSCEDVVPGCTAERLPDLTLTGDQIRTPLESVDGFSLEGLIGFDEAFSRGAEEGGMYPSDTVQVTLGATDASEHHWGNGRRLFYAIDWEGGLCGFVGGGPRQTPSSPLCVAVSAGTIIDAVTGKFIVSGEGPPRTP